MDISILDALQLPFMARAFATIAVLAVAAGVVGLGISFREMEFVSDGMVHAVFPGLVIGAALGGSAGLLPGAVVAALAAAGAIAALALTACASGAGDAGGDAAASSEVGPITEGKLTIATGEPAFAPWVIDNEPENGEGFEAAVSYAVADKLGYSKDDVVWVRSTFDAAIAPGPKDFDLNIQQFSVTPERAKAVDFSSPYYETTQAVVAAKGSKAAAATSIADLKDAVIGVMSGTTSL